MILGALAASASARPYPETIPLPDGWAPEGIATGVGNQFFAGSRTTGGIFKGNLKTGNGEIFVEPHGGAALGMKVDRRRNRLFVAGGDTGMANVYNASTGRLLRSFALGEGPWFINDVTLTRRAAYFTDSVNQRLGVIRLGRHGRLPQHAETMPLTGDLQYDADPGTFDLNGIAAAGRGRLVTVQSRTGELFLVNARTGHTDEVDLGGETVTNGDGLLLRGRRLYVVQNINNRIAVVHLERGLHRGDVKRFLADSDFDTPTTVARKAGFLWAVNARFTTPVTPTTTYEVVRVRP